LTCGLSTLTHRGLVSHGSFGKKISSAERPVVRPLGYRYTVVGGGAVITFSVPCVAR
jgi:hypothetical protein